MGKDKGKKEAERQARERDALANQRIVEAARPTPVQNFLDEENLAFLESSSGKRGPLDVLTMRGMEPYAAQFAADTAEARQGEERTGQGLIQMGSAASDPNLAAMLKQNSADRQRQASGANFARQYAAKNAEVRGSVLPLLSLTQNRNMGLASLTSNRADRSWDNFFAAKRQPGVWENLFNAAF